MNCVWINNQIKKKKNLEIFLKHIFGPIEHIVLKRFHSYINKL